MMIDDPNIQLPDYLKKSLHKQNSRTGKDGYTNPET